MKALTVTCNGERLCTAGSDDANVLVASVSSVKLEGVAESPIVSLMVHGVNGQTQPVSWTSKQLSLGDEVTMRLSDVEQSDPPNVLTGDGDGAG